MLIVLVLLTAVHEDQQLNRTKELCCQGTKDAGFGEDGKVVVDFPGITTSGAYGLALTAAGRIVVAAAIEVNAQTQCALACLDKKGQVVPAFGDQGYILAPLGDGIAAQPKDVIALASGKILLLAEQLDASGIPVPVLVRFHADGCIDTCFGNGGKVSVQLPGERFYDSPTSIYERSNGSVLLSVERAVAGDDNLQGVIVYLTSDGQLDTSCNDQGFLVIPVADQSQVSLDGITEQDNQQIIAWGTAGEFGLFVRLTATGEMDSRLGNRGVVLVDSADDQGEPQGLEFYHVQPQECGGLMAFGSTNTRPYKSVIVSINESGCLSPTFNHGKPVVTDGDAAGSRWLAGSVQADDSITAVGLTGIPYGGEETQFLVGKYVKSGELNEAFADKGLLRIDLDAGPDITRCFAFGEDGRVLLAGTSDTPGPGSKTYVVCFS